MRITKVYFEHQAEDGQLLAPWISHRGIAHVGFHSEFVKFESSEQQKNQTLTEPGRPDRVSLSKF